MDSPWPVFSLLLFFRCLNISLPEPWGLGPWRASDSTILANPIIFFLFFFIQQEAKIFLIETVQISNPAAVTLLKHQKRSSFQMVNSILAFTISLLLFLRAGTFAVNTFACDMTTSTPFTSTSATSVSTTSFCSLPSWSLYVFWNGWDSFTLNFSFSAATNCACWDKASILALKKLCQYLMLTITSVDWNKVELYLLTLTFNVCMFLIVTW